MATSAWKDARSRCSCAERQQQLGQLARHHGVDNPEPRPGVERPHFDLPQIFSLVEVGSIVWYPPASLARRHTRAGIVYREVTDLPPSTLVVAWRRDSRSAAVAAFVRAAGAVAAAAPPTRPVGV